MPGDKFLTVAVNLLHRALLEAPRPQAKALFRELRDGRSPVLTRLELEDRSTVRFDLALEQSAYRGRLSFGAMRAGVSLLLANIVERMQAGDTPRNYAAEHDPRQLLFGVTAVVVEDGQANVLALGADLGGGEPVVQLQLMYLDPDQFARGDGAAGEASGA